MEIAVSPELATLSRKQCFENLYPSSSSSSIDTFSLIHTNIFVVFILTERKRKKGVCLFCLKDLNNYILFQFLSLQITLRQTSQISEELHADT